MIPNKQQFVATRNSWAPNCRGKICENKDRTLRESSHAASGRWRWFNKPQSLQGWWCFKKMWQTPQKKIEKLATWKYELNIMHTILETCVNLFRGYYNLKFPSGLSWWGRGVIWLGETSMDVPWLWLGNIGNMVMGWKSVGNPSLYVRYGSHNMLKEVCIYIYTYIHVTCIYIYIYYTYIYIYIWQ